MMIETIQRELIYIWYYFSVQLDQIFWYWAFGMAFGSLVSVFGKEKIHKMFAALREKKAGVLSLFAASLLGIASPICMYGTIPIAASLMNASLAQSQNGTAEDYNFQAVLAAFMMSSILLNPQLLFYTAALGAHMIVIRFVICFLCGVAAGFAVRRFYKSKQFFNFSSFYDSESGCGVSRDTDPNPMFRFLKSFARNVKATGLYFLAGLLLSALFQRYVPQETFARLFGSGNRGFGLLMSATVGVPLYVCGGGTIPLLQSLMQSGMSAGGAAAFMITGPAAKITNLGALKIVLGLKHFFIYLGFAAVFALLCGFIINLLIIQP